MNRTIRQAVVAAASDLGYPSLKDEQLKVVTAFLQERDAFAVLPTGYRKSLCFGCLPLAFDKLNLGVGSSSPSSIVVVITPLTAIMKDQVWVQYKANHDIYLKNRWLFFHILKVDSFSARGLAAAYVTGEPGNEEMKRGVSVGAYQLVFFTPELLMDNKRWRKVLMSDIYTACLKAFVVDEAHTVRKWYEISAALLVG